MIKLENFSAQSVPECLRLRVGGFLFNRHFGGAPMISCFFGDFNLVAEIKILFIIGLINTNRSLSIF